MYEKSEPDSRLTLLFEDLHGRIDQSIDFAPIHRNLTAMMVVQPKTRIILSMRIVYYSMLSLGISAYLAVLLLELIWV